MYIAYGHGSHATVITRARGPTTQATGRGSEGEGEGIGEDEVDLAVRRVHGAKDEACDDGDYELGRYNRQIVDPQDGSRSTGAASLIVASTCIAVDTFIIIMRVWKWSTFDQRRTNAIPLILLPQRTTTR